MLTAQMGTRTFEESEVNNHEIRPDLLQKLLELSPDEVTAEEKVQGGITKVRYQCCRAEHTTTASLGFRVDGMQVCVSGAPQCVPKVLLHRTRSQAQVLEVILRFLKGHHESKDLCQWLLQQLLLLRQRLETSDTFSHHEMINTSLLFVYDQWSATCTWTHADKAEGDGDGGAFGVLSLEH